MKKSFLAFQLEPKGVLSVKKKESAQLYKEFNKLRQYTKNTYYDKIYKSSFEIFS